MWSDPVTRAPFRGWDSANSARIAISPGISCSASRISLRPNSARERSATLKSRPLTLVAVVLAGLVAVLMRVRWSPESRDETTGYRRTAAPQPDRSSEEFSPYTGEKASKLYGHPMDDALQVNDEVTIPLDEVELRASRSSGPGGQHANVTASRIEAVFDVNASRALDDEQRELLRRRLGDRVTAV